MTRELIAQAMGLFAPVVLALLGLAAATLLPVIRTRIKNKLAADSLQLLATLATAGVADAYQRVVADLKDPRQPGTWTEAMAASVKNAVVANVMKLGVSPLNQLAAGGLDESALRQLVGQLVEASVVQLKHDLGETRVAVSAGEVKS